MPKHTVQQLPDALLSKAKVAVGNALQRQDYSEVVLAIPPVDLSAPSSLLEFTQRVAEPLREHNAVTIKARKVREGVMIPSVVVFEDLNDMVAYIDLTEEFLRVKNLLADILPEPQSIKSKTVQFLLSATDEDLDDIRKGLSWITDESVAGLSYKELPWPGGTKALKKKGLKTVLTDLSGLNEDEWSFSTRSVPVVCITDCLSGNYQDVPITEACQMVLDRNSAAVLIHENKAVNPVTRASLFGKDVMIVSGAGNNSAGLLALTKLPTTCIVAYCGDIDAHGYAILARFRKMFTNHPLPSVGMDSEQFIGANPLRNRKVRTPTVDHQALTAAELGMLQHCVNGFLYEQEYIELTPADLAILVDVEDIL